MTNSKQEQRWIQTVARAPGILGLAAALALNNAAHAQVVLADSDFGINSVIRDEVHQQDFLALTYTLGWTYAAIANELGAGGWFYGWRIATKTDMLLLGDAAGIVDQSTGGESRTRALELRAWFGQPRTTSVAVYSRGIVSDQIEVSGILGRQAFNIGVWINISPTRAIFNIGGWAGETSSGETVHLVREAISDRDGDGLIDSVETDTGFFIDADHTGTNPDNPDSDGDGLMDGTEVDMQAASTVSNCPDPNVPDSDGDTLSDNVEVDLGTSACSSDTDNDLLPDPVDPDPTTPDQSSGALEDTTRALADYVEALDLSAFEAPNDNAAKGRRNSLATRIRNAANRIADGNFSAAVALLEGVDQKVDGDPAQPDWILRPSDAADVIHDTLVSLIALLS